MKVWLLHAQQGEYSQWSKWVEGVFSSEAAAQAARDKLLLRITYGSNGEESGDCIAAFMPDDLEIDEWEIDKHEVEDEPRPGHVHRADHGPCDSQERLITLGLIAGVAV